MEKKRAEPPGEDHPGDADTIAAVSAAETGTGDPTLGIPREDLQDLAREAIVKFRSLNGGDDSDGDGGDDR